MRRGVVNHVRLMHNLIKHTPGGARESDVVPNKKGTLFASRVGAVADKAGKAPKAGADCSTAMQVA